MYDDCPNCSRLADEITSPKASLIREKDGRFEDRLRREARDAGLRAGVRPGAEDDLMARLLAMGEWKEEKGRIVLVDPTGLPARNVAYDVLTLDLAAREAKAPAPHLFSESTAQTVSAEVPNPRAKATWNLTQQGQIVTRDRAMAARLAREAGCVVPAEL